MFLELSTLFDGAGEKEAAILAKLVRSHDLPIVICVLFVTALAEKQQGHFEIAASNLREVIKGLSPNTLLADRAFLEKLLADCEYFCYDPPGNMT